MTAVPVEITLLTKLAHLSLVGNPLPDEVWKLTEGTLTGWFNQDTIPLLFAYLRNLTTGEEPTS